MSNVSSSINPFSRSSCRRRPLGWLAASALVMSLLMPIPAAIAAQGARPAASSPAPASAPCHLGDASFFRDQGLTMKVATKLQFNKQLLAEKIDVKVNGGVASLSGGVSTPEHVALAGDLARQVSGVNCVNNFLRVGPPSASPDRPMN